MKKNYLKPRTAVIDCNVEVMQVNGSTVYGGKYDDWAPTMGTDDEGDNGNVRFWNELN